MADRDALPEVFMSTVTNLRSKESRTVVSIRILGCEEALTPNQAETFAAKLITAAQKARQTERNRARAPVEARDAAP